MRLTVILTALIFLFSGVFAIAFGQTPGGAVKPTYIAGDVAAISARSIVISTKTGPVEVMLTEKTVFKRASAENFSLAAATPGALADIGVGDKVTVSALQAADGKSMNARTVYFVTKADIAAKNAKEADEWRKRGITGRVVSVNGQTNQINVELRSLTGSTNLTVTPKDKAKFLRYAPDSIRYDEAKDSSLADVKAGDMLRALGDKGTDGTSFAAEKVITGAFQTIAGTVKSIDVAKNEVVITNLQTKKDVTVVVSDSSLLKRFPGGNGRANGRFSGWRNGWSETHRPGRSTAGRTRRRGTSTGGRKSRIWRPARRNRRDRRHARPLSDYYTGRS